VAGGVAVNARMPARNHAIIPFILVCKPDSHKTLYEWMEGLERLGQVSHVNPPCWTGKQHVTELLSFVNHVPLRGSVRLMHDSRLDPGSPLIAKVRKSNIRDERLRPHQID
jgi:hypothetical protein